MYTEQPPENRWPGRYQFASGSTFDVALSSVVVEASSLLRKMRFFLLFCFSYVVFFFRVAFYFCFALVPGTLALDLPTLIL